MSNDALERLKNRQRPSVPSRDASLNPGSPDIEISRYLGNEDATQQPELLTTKQTTLRLEVQISARLSEVARANGISREVLIEALVEHYEADPAAWQAILAQAKRKGEHRMQLANIKRAKSMMQRFGEASE